MGTTVLIQISINDLQDMLQNAIKSEVNEALQSKQVLVARTKISRQEVATMLDVSPDYVYQLTSNKEISFHKPGKAVFFYREEIEEYISKKK
jgi:excisionase family DNA binding protein